MLGATLPLSVAKSERLAWLEANLVATEGVMVDEVFTPGEGYREVVELTRGAGESPVRVLAADATDLPTIG